MTRVKSARFTPRAPILTACAILIFAFIYLPIVMLIVYSFNRDGVASSSPTAQSGIPF
jgi:ABC-type spermidine/putrescine transport system permease subunit II